MTAAAVEPLLVTEPGVYDMPADAYHADPVPGGSLSSSGARRILPPGCPAKYDYERQHGRPEKRVFDLGHAAHREVLGAGETIVIVEAPNYMTSKAKAARDGAYAAGKTPILRREYENVVVPMAAALRAHPTAGRLFAPGLGVAEPSFFWWDGEGEQRIMRRARLDWLPSPTPGRRLVIPDYKTCESAAPEDVKGAIGRLGYYMQAAWYLDAVTALLEPDPARPPAFVFVMQEKTPPYVVTVCQLRPDTLRLARERNRRAIELYRRCRATNTWPGYSDQVLELGLPGWLENQLTEESFDDQ